MDTLTPEQATAITERHERQRQLLEENRAARHEQLLDQHSHVGVDIARSIPQAEAREVAYGELAQLANRLYSQGFETAGRVVASLCRGMVRGTRDQWGSDAAKALLTMVTVETPAPKVEARPTITGNDTSLSGVAYPVKPYRNGAGDTQLPLATPEEIASVGVSAAEAAAGLEEFLDLTMGAGLEDEPDDHEVPDSTRPALSPEPDPDAQERAKARRAAKRTAQGST